MCLMRPFLFHVANNKILNIYYVEGCILQKQKRNVFVLIMVSMQISPLPPLHVCVLIWRSESWFSSTICVPEIELNSLGLAKSTLTHWAISVAQLAHIIEVKKIRRLILVIEETDYFATLRENSMLTYKIPVSIWRDLCL